ncbi:hypothetical protein ABTE18_21060, partial [Acinetobacter baumannii]
MRLRALPSQHQEKPDILAMNTLPVCSSLSPSSPASAVSRPLRLHPLLLAVLCAWSGSTLAQQAAASDGSSEAAT